jgi:NAD(P)-dependent dehydrogenase (short-subunit alcohol dehydrogenase family)
MAQPADLMKDIKRDGIKKGDVAVISGGGGGFGRAVSRRLARDGARVAVWDWTEETGRETVDLVEKEGGEARFYKVDIGDVKMVDAAAADVIKDMGVPYLLMNNASIYPRASILEMDAELWEKVIRVNLSGFFFCSKAFGKHMVDNERGNIINVASGRAIQGAVRGAHYAASKAGVISLTKTLALEWAKFGVRVNCVVPGVSLTAQPLEDTTLDELLARSHRFPLGRIGHPDDIACMVAFLASPDAAFMTGQSVAMNGGTIMLP